VNATYATAGYVGLVSTEPTEQPPYPCAHPFKEITDLSECEKLSSEHLDALNRLFETTPWEPLEIEDPDAEDGGDMKLWSAPQCGNYHYVRMTMTLKNTTIKRAVEVIASDTLKARQEFSADTVGLDNLTRINSDLVIQRLAYWAPPPVAGRDFCFLSNKKVSDTEATIWGCSVDYAKCEEGQDGTVRGACLWGWRMKQAGPHVLVEYCNCSDPRGWVPGVLFSWIKTAVAKEFVNARAVIYGKKVNVEHVQLSDCGVTETDLKDQLNAVQPA
jgi:hypothetical protein